MKAALLAILLVLAVAIAASAQQSRQPQKQQQKPASAAETEKDWQRKAVSEYPDLAIKDSKFNKRFLELVAQRRKEEPAFFKDPKWSLQLAEEIATAQPALVETEPVLIIREFRVLADFFRPQKTVEGVISCGLHPAPKPGRFVLYSPVSSTVVIKDTAENIETVRRLIARHGR